MSRSALLLEQNNRHFPRGLLDLEPPPTRLFFEGTVPDPSRPAIAIVGSRQPSREAERFAFDLARDLARVGAVIVSGGARGIDAAAHEGALAAEASTISILAGDVMRPSPAGNRALFRRIIRQGGALVSENEQMPAHGGGFVLRNRLIAAWARVVVVVEARLRSGTASTANAARRLGRPLFAVPWSPYHSPGAGCLQLLQEGARLLFDAQPILSLLGPALGSAEVALARRPERLPGETGRVLEALELHQGASVDELATRLALPLSEILRTVAQLELSGLIEPVGAGRYAVCGTR